MMRDEAEMTLILRDIRFGYGREPVLDGVALRVAAGEIVCLYGPSGCGKSTVLRIAAGLERLKEGTVELDGVVLSSPALHTPPEKRGVGLVFQDFVLFQHMTAAENVAFGLDHLSAKARAERVRAELAAVGLDGFEKRRPAQLSGGQQQRVALARAFARDPKALLLDEPFASIDAALRRRLRADLRRMLKDRGTPAIIVTHDAEEAVELGDRIALMRRGRIIEDASPEDLWRAARTPEGALLFAGAQQLAFEARGASAATPCGVIAAAPPAPSGLAVILPGGVRAEAADAGPLQAIDCRFAGPDWLVLLEPLDHPGLFLRAASAAPLPSGARAVARFDPARVRLFAAAAQD
jgi:iron(III) transport system ATP-binding protein